ncbi:MAG: hydrogenase maturation protease [Tannerellaceae bacterium]|nr:hydrogenase maturation protease [Tannerellaceae bacterium]
MSTLILGVENMLLKDEGVGIHTVYALKREILPRNVKIVDGEANKPKLLKWAHEYDHLIIVDATIDNNPPGTVRLMRPRYSTNFPLLMSAQEIRLRDIIDQMYHLGYSPNIYLIVVSVATINRIGTELSPAVASAIPRVIGLIKKIIRRSEKINIIEYYL